MIETLIETTDFDDPDSIEDLRKQIAAQDKDVLIANLKADLETPLPDDLEGTNKAVSNRVSALDNIRILNTTLGIGQPSLEDMHLRDVEVEDRKWLVYPFIPLSETTLLTGQGGVGKSFLMLQIACQMACGGSDLNFSTEDLRGGNNPYFVEPKINLDFADPIPVVYASYEDDLSEIRRRLNYLYNDFDWVKDKQQVIFDHFHPYSIRSFGPLWGPELGKHWQTRSQATKAAETLKAKCEEKKAKLLMIDPVSAGFYGDENNKAEVYAFVNSWADWGKQTETAVLISGHLPKSEAARKTGYSGTAAWEGAFRSLFVLDKFDINSTQNNDPQWYLGIRAIKGNYAPVDRVEIPVKRGKYGWIEGTGEVKIDAQRQEAHEAYAQATGYTQQEENGHYVDPDDL